MWRANDQKGVVGEQIFGDLPNPGVDNIEWATAPGTTTGPSR